MAEVNCGPLLDPSDGTVRYNGTTLGYVAVYECNEGFEIFGAVNRICEENGLWEPAIAALCLRKCL